jgi:hypothetical protein
MCKNREAINWILKLGSMILLIWLPFFLTFYPGVGMHDEIYVSQNPKGTSNQPIMYNLLLAFFYKSCLKLFGDDLLGMGVVVFLMMAFMAFSIAYVLYWVRQRTSSIKLVVLYGLYFTFTPIIIDFAIAAVKDKLFGVILLLLIPVSYDLLRKKPESLKLKEIAPFFVLCICMMWTRNNGPHIFLVMSVLIAIFIKENRKSFVKLAVPIFLIGMLPSFFMGKNFTEGIGIPLQQVCRVVALNREIPAHDLEYIDKMMPIEQIKKQYHPRNVDRIKWSKTYHRRFVDTHRKQFLRVWLDLLRLYPRDYFDAWRLNTQGFWGYLEGHEWQSRFAHAYEYEIFKTKHKVGLADGFRVSDLNVVPKAMKEKLGHYLWDYSKYIPSGICLWLSVAIGVILMYQRKYKMLLILAPAVLCSLTLVLAAPIAKAFRYTFYYVLCLPLFMLLPFLPGDTYEKKDLF